MPARLASMRIADDRIGDAERKIVMRMDAAFGLGLQYPVIGKQPVAEPVHVERAARIGDIDAVRAIGFHQQRLLRERLRPDHVAHHQETRDVHPQVARGGDVLLRDIRLGAMRRDAHRTDAELEGVAQLLDRADARDQQGGQPGMVYHLGGGLDPFPVGVRAKAVIEARAVQAVAMRHLDRVDPGGIECPGDRADMVDAVPVADRVHAVAQRHVLDVELGAGGIEIAHATALASWRRAIFSAVRRAAEVMMSRLPA
jgi:hypothetical protein